MIKGTYNVIMLPRNENRGPWNVNGDSCNVIMRPRNMIMGPWIVNRGPWNVNRGPWNIYMDRGM